MRSRGALGGGGWLVPEAEVYARHAVSTLGVAHHTTGYWPHTLQVSRGRTAGLSVMRMPLGYPSYVTQLIFKICINPRLHLQRMSI